MLSVPFAWARAFALNWIVEPSLSSTLTLLVAASVIYFVVKSYFEYRVRRYHLLKHIVIAL